MRGVLQTITNHSDWAISSLDTGMVNGLDSYCTYIILATTQNGLHPFIDWWQRLQHMLSNDSSGAKKWRWLWISISLCDSPINTLRELHHNSGPQMGATHPSLRRLSRACTFWGSWKTIMVHIYTAFIESILCFSISVWYAAEDQMVTGCNAYHPWLVRFKDPEVGKKDDSLTLDTNCSSPFLLAGGYGPSGARPFQQFLFSCSQVHEQRPGSPLTHIPRMFSSIP